MEIENLVICSHVVHYEHKGRLYAYGPYAREIDIWGDFFPQVLITYEQVTSGNAIDFTVE